ncbi:hypothetical protein [Roseivirga pacifica]|uniref:hypothetical protein n=1 Tax=Roseivirga pacifica TaxID=1267423 RepID=UPI003BAD366C
MNNFIRSAALIILAVTFDNQLHSQSFEFSAKVGTYKSDFLVNGIFDGIILQNNDNNDAEHWIGVETSFLITDRFQLTLGIENYSNFGESLLIYDTQEPQFNGQYIKKGMSHWYRAYFLPITFSYSIIKSQTFSLNIDVGPELFFGKNRNRIDEIDLGRQHERLNEIVPILNQSAKSTIAQLRLGVTFTYKRFGLSFHIKEDFDQSANTHITFRGKTYSYHVDRSITAFNLSYTFLRVGNN